MDVIHLSMGYEYKLNGLTMASACLYHKYGISCLQCVVIFLFFYFNFFTVHLMFSGIFAKSFQFFCNSLGTFFIQFNLLFLISYDMYRCIYFS